MPPLGAVRAATTVAAALHLTASALAFTAAALAAAALATTGLAAAIILGELRRLKV